MTILKWKTKNTTFFGSSENECRVRNFTLMKGMDLDPLPKQKMTEVIQI